MEFKFDANQDFQIEAINAIANLFEGQPNYTLNLQFGLGLPAVANQLDLSEADLLTNLRIIQTDHGINPDDTLQCIEETITTMQGQQAIRFPNFSVEMETGTGKTYVYLRTALELCQRYGFRKFIIVVPSVAVREGVIKTLQITQKHFQALYNNIPYRFYGYASENLSQVHQFALSDSVEFMVMTLAAFNKADQNVIHQTTDRLQGETPIHLIQAARPILILDEPQNMESEKSIAALSTLHPLLVLRYSATHRVPYNIVYRLTPADAYRLRLVKRIEVSSVRKEGDTLQPYIRVESTMAKKRTLTARLTIHQLQKSGKISQKVVTVKPGDSLAIKSGGRTIYEPYTIDEINDGLGFVRFGNNIELQVGHEIGSEKEAIFEGQIYTTIEEHFRKQAILKEAGIKVLSLFFIDRVDNYTPPVGEGAIQQIFNQAFNTLKQRYPDWKDHDPAKVQAAYFAQKRTKGQLVFKDTTSGRTKEDRATFRLIMQDKEQLLSFEEPVAFIFSHSALREGWDNPNVFQICTLNQTLSEVRKRQEVGRGVRLAVNQTGERVLDERVNVLTVVANESYDQFVRQLQSEIAEEYRREIEARYGKSIEALTTAERQKIEAEYGADILPPRPANARERTFPKLQKQYTLKPEFQALWDKIKHKTRYNVTVDTTKLIDEVVADLGRTAIAPPRVAVTKAKVDLNTEGAFQAWQMSAAKTLVSLAGRHPLPNLVDVMTNLMEQTTPPMRLTRRTLLEVVRRAPNPQAAIDNPNDFAQVAVALIKQKLSDQLIAGIQYEKINDWYHMERFEDELKSWKEYVVPATLSLYDGIICDSQIEQAFVENLENRQDVKFYIKLPDWFKVPTPIGYYNPDWAIVMEDPENPAGELLYLVRETKGSMHKDDLRGTEGKKIQCGIAHFEGALGVDYKVIQSTEQLP
ncbi:MAG: DEAD/DEAH box helicase family protein [Chloroflexota bacterium]